jgi:hypothetical protein
MTPTERTQRRRQRLAHAKDDAEERKAICHELGSLIAELRAILKGCADTDLRFVIGHKAGLQRAIEVLKRRRSDVKAIRT